MATQAEIVQKLETLKQLIDGIDNNAFKLPILATPQKLLLKGLVDVVILFVQNGTPNALEAAKFILKNKLRVLLNSTERFSLVRVPLPNILNLIDEIYLNIDTLFTNTPPNAVMKICEPCEGGTPTCEIQVPYSTKFITAGQCYIYDASDSWDEQGNIDWENIEWDFGNGDIKQGKVVKYTYPYAGGPFPCTLTVPDTGSPPESNAVQIEIIPQ